MRDVTERDFRMPEFRDADPADYEFRNDGKIVRKDRWQTGIMNIASIVGGPRWEYEIHEVVARGPALVHTVDTRARAQNTTGDAVGDTGNRP